MVNTSKYGGVVMNKKKNTKSTKTNPYKKLATSKGFYITLCSLAAIMGFTIYSSHLRNEMNEQIAAFDQDSWQEVISQSEIEVIDIDELSEDTPVASYEKFEPETVITSAPAQPSTQAREFSMDFPIDGEIIAPCSVEELVFCESMQDWRTHNGTDISAKIGDPVKAAEAGTVSEVYKDDMLGVVVVLDHGNNISSLYGNLQNLDFITVGTEVQKGDIIGGIGDSGILEASFGPHLHFEVMSNGEYQNPEKFIQQ